MQEIYITNTEVFYHDYKAHLKVFGWNRNNEQVEYEVMGLHPTFYVEKPAFTEKKSMITSHSAVIDTSYGHESLFDDSLVQVMCRTPKKMGEVADLFEVEETFEADIDYTDYCRIQLDIETGIRVPDGTRCHYSEVEPVDMVGEFDPRVVTLDIETDDRGDFPEMGEKRVLSIVAHDSIEDEYVGFLDLNGKSMEDAFGLTKPPEELADLGIDGLDELKVRPSEDKMLREFACWINEKNPDLLTGWYFENFDAPYIVARMEEVGVNPLRMARHDNVRWYEGGAHIGGRTVYDLLNAYKDTKYGELRSYSLDNVAAEELDDSKIEHQDMGFFEMYQQDIRKFLEYNAKDVRLTVEVNREAGVIDFKNALRDEVGLDFEKTRENNDFIEMFTRRKLHEKGVHGPTANFTGRDDYEGGHVFDPATGVFENVTGIDVKSLYPMTMAMFNMSPEVKLESPPPGFPCNTAPNGIHFRQDVDGIFKELVEDAIGLKEDYRTKKRNANTREEAEMWDERYGVSKTITNSVYGVLGWEFFFLYDKEVAEAVTLAGQACIKRSAQYVEEETTGTVIYGDTDSNYIKWFDEWDMETCIAAATNVCGTLNNVVYPRFANEEFGVPVEDCLWEIEPENYLRRFFQSGKKKRYAYLCYWDEGDDLSDDPEVKISGYGSKRSDFSMLSQETQKEVVKLILNDADDTTIATVVEEAADEITPEMDNWERIGIPGGFGKRISREGGLAENEECYRWSSNGDHPQDAHPRAAWNANHMLGTDYGKGDKPMRVYVAEAFSDELDREINVIAFETNEQIANYDGETTLHVDAQRMREATVTRPMRPVLSAVGISIEAALKGQLQTGLSGWM